MIHGVLALNLAVVIRAVRFGLNDANRKLVASYFEIDPLHGLEYRDLESIPAVSLESLLHSPPMILVDGTHAYVDGSLPSRDLLALLALLVDRAPQVVLEVGTFHGMTTRLMARNLPGAKIHTVDLPEELPDTSAQPSALLPKDDFHLISSRRLGHAYRSDPSVKNVVQHAEDTAVWDFGAAEDATFFFIDGSHTYEYAKNDSLKSLAACAGRCGTIVWHDCNRIHPGVTRWLAEMIADGFPIQRIEGTDLAVLDYDGQRRVAGRDNSLTGSRAPALNGKGSLHA
jgi:hypothetical protein